MPAVFPVAAASPSVAAALVVAEEPVTVQTAVVSGEEVTASVVTYLLITCLCLSCVAVCASSSLIRVKGADVREAVECLAVSVLCGEWV